MVILILFSCLNAISSVDEEALLRAKAALVAKKVHVRNLNLIGVNPSTCKSQDDKKLYIEQMKQIKSASLNHCSTLMDTVLKPLNDEIAKVDAGQLVYAPVPQIVQEPQAADEEKNDGPENAFAIAHEAEPEIIIENESAPHPTGLSRQEIERIFESYEDNQKAYTTSEEDNLFNILSKAYVRNLNRLIERDKTGN